MSVGTFLAYNLNTEDVEEAAEKDSKSGVDGRTDFTQVKSDAELGMEQQRVTDLLEQQVSGAGRGRRTAAAAVADGDADSEGAAPRVVPRTKSGMFGKRRRAQRGSLSPTKGGRLPVSVIEGPLLKKSARGAWQQRYFSAKSHYLTYAKVKGGESMGAVDIVGPQSTIALVAGELVVTGLNGDVHSQSKGETRTLRTFILDSTSGGAASIPTLDEWARELLAVQRAMRS